MSVPHVDETENRWDTIRAIWQQHQWLYVVGGFLLGLITFPLLETVFSDFSDFITQFTPVALGSAITIILLNSLSERRFIRARKVDLLRDLRSGLPDIVKQALFDLRESGYLIGEEALLNSKSLQEVNLRHTDLSATILQNANLQRTNLQGANLRGSDLRDANLRQADLQNADLREAQLQNTQFRLCNLRGADASYAKMQRTDCHNADMRRARLNHTYLQHADLSDADLRSTDLEEANLREAKLTNADLNGATLRLTNLRGADLTGADLQNAIIIQLGIDEKTILPDGTHWTPESDIMRFTTRNHPNFWRSDDIFSPAYDSDDA